MDAKLTSILEEFLALHFLYHPIDATFMGSAGHDHRLPSADADAKQRELDSLIVLERRAEALPVGECSAARVDRRLVLAQIRHAARNLENRPRYTNPTWYTSEAAFSIISLLLPATPTRPLDELRAAVGDRIAAIPKFLAEGRQHLANQPIPSEWVESARLESHALLKLLQSGIHFHPVWSEELTSVCETAAQAVLQFEADLAGHDDADPACGGEHLAFLMREVHGLPYSPREAEALALQGFERAREELEAMAAKLNAGVDWREQLAQLAADHPALDRVVETYEEWNAVALDKARDLVTPASGYGLSFKQLPQWAEGIAGDLYFLFYRSPSAQRAGAGSVYWVFPPGSDKEAYLRAQNTATIKSVHVVHHGSIGHHTQNANARGAASQLPRIAGTDCASNIAFLSGGTMIEGWACYAQGLMAEADAFYSPLELLSLKQAEMRNAASCLGDIRLHCGIWSVEQLRTFYSDEVGYNPARLWSGTVRNSIYPATRLMYWLGTQAIQQMRSKWDGGTKEFHDALLHHGAMPIHWVAEEMGLSL